MDPPKSLHRKVSTLPRARSRCIRERTFEVKKSWPCSTGDKKTKLVRYETQEKNCTAELIWSLLSYKLETFFWYICWGPQGYLKCISTKNPSLIQNLCLPYAINHLRLDDGDGPQNTAFREKDHLNLFPLNPCPVAPRKEGAASLSEGFDKLPHAL